MALLRGSASVTRLNATSVPEMPDFDQHPFEPIPAGSEVRERIGFVPFRPEAPYQVGDRRFAFRVRVDRRKPDATRLRERLQQLIQTEMETTGAPFVGPKKRKELRHLAEEELIPETSPQSKIVEGVLEDRVLYLGTTAKSWLGTVLLQLRKVEVLAEPKTPWGDLGDEEVYSELVETADASESVLGCRFLKTVFEDRELMFEPESGSVRLQTPEAKVSLTGAVLPELHRYLEREKDVEILAAKLLAPEARFRLDALTWRLSGLSVETLGKGHWTEVLDERLEKITAVFELLDRKYEAWRRGSAGGS